MELLNKKLHAASLCGHGVLVQSLHWLLWVQARKRFWNYQNVESDHRATSAACHHDPLLRFRSGSYIQVASENKLTLNATKTKCMLFGTTQKIGTVVVPLHVKVGDVLPEQVNSFRYLGLNFDPCLNWNHHIKVISSKLAQRTGVLYRVRPFISAGTASTLCKALILLLTRYCSILYMVPDFGWQHVAATTTTE